MQLMEIMEDGNLVDRVRILLQRDMQYYQEQQTVLRESLCVRVCGGKLDFPRHASFAASKIVMWWEVEFSAAFKRTSGFSFAESSVVETDDRVIKNIQPDEFVLLVIDTAEQLIEHLHTLIQESLDHADLTVLTATLGAAALIRNCLWCYNQYSKGIVSSDSSTKINKSYKSYNEMAEAVAERLLDLHCRLISLYILNEADSLSWHSDKYFFEKERCSYVVQMWWLYMQGTKADLWNTVPPKMAQRVFSGMLNDSLSIIITRFIHGRPSLARTEQYWTDAFNVLSCTGYLALGACVSGEEMTALSKMSTAVRDIHAKCNELLISLLLRGTPLPELYQLLRHGLDSLTILEQSKSPAPWLLICAPNLFGPVNSDEIIETLSEDRAVILELNVLRHQPQPNWTQVSKVLSMNDYSVSKMLMNALVRQCIGCIYKNDLPLKGKLKKEEKGCGGFLCSSSPCERTLKISATLGLYSCTHILALTAKNPETVIIAALKFDPDWSTYLDRKQTSASIYQTMSLAIGCFAELYIIVPLSILHTCLAMDNSLPAHCHPIGGSVLLQILCAALYTVLIEESVKPTEAVEPPVNEGLIHSTFNIRDRSSAATALAEAICSIDEDNKHTAQIEAFLLKVRTSIAENNHRPETKVLESKMSIVETYTDQLLFTDSGRLSLKVVHEYLVRASDWILTSLKCDKDLAQSNFIELSEISPICKPLTHIMFHIEDATFDQFLINYEKTNWRKALRMPLSVNIERVRSQLLLRPEFKNVGDLPQEEREIVNSIKKLCSPRRIARFKSTTKCLRRKHHRTMQ
ncbi:uncharacterized protein [Prorops nasuta]|uniref:uncharacterized protein isoform X2 n=1 Tax=Prorops nasuta TaxID=863751 RepID=UPI0034CEC127